MKVTIDIHSGFCWGVVRTIDIAESELTAGELYSLGEIIHNPMEIERLEGEGLKTVSADQLDSLRGKRVLIRAHGEPPETYRRARELGIEIVDATCPVVTKVQERIRKFYNQGYQVVIFGKKDHAEVIGLVGQTNGQAVVIRTAEEISKLDLSRKTVLFSQTTMDKSTFYEIKKRLEERVKDLVIDSFEDEAIDFHAKDTICGQVSGRDKKIREFARENEVVIFVAGRHSSNGKVLFEMCRSENLRTHFVESESEVQPEWFEGVETVGISGATSTPRWLMERVKARVEQMCPQPASA